MIFDRHANLKYKYGNRHFWCRGYYVDTVGKYEGVIRDYIKNQLQEGVFVFIVRQQLAGYRAKGPKYLLIMYIASLVLEVFYIGAGSLLSGVNLLTSSESSIMLISSILVSLFMIGANKVYFDKRAHLFTR